MITKTQLILLALLLVLVGCAGLPVIEDRQQTFAMRDTDTTQLGKAIQQLAGQKPGQSGLYLLRGGIDAFVARVALATQSERSIDAQYYLLHDDLIGQLFLDALLKAADRGVRVRLLVDDMALDNKKDIFAVALDAHPNIDIRVFNPFIRGISRLFQFVSRFSKVSRRMHNKSYTVDNQVTVIGGRNIGNEYFEADPDVAFQDLDVIAIGPVVNEVSSSFDLYWNAPVSYPVKSLIKSDPTPQDLSRVRQQLADFRLQQQDSAYLHALRKSPLAAALRDKSLKITWGSAEVLYDDPAKVTSDREQTGLRLATQLQPYTESITEELTIFSPYFVPGKKGVAKLVELRKRGVRVRVLTNSLASTDVTAVHAGYAKYRKSMLKAGIELYEIDKTLTRKQRSSKKGTEGSSKSSLHAKSFVLDRERVFIGSMNMDPRSIVENTEIGLLIESTDIAIGMANWFDRSISSIAFRLGLQTDAEGLNQIVWYREMENETRVHTTEPNTGFWRRLGVGLLRLLPIEPLL